MRRGTVIRRGSGWSFTIDVSLPGAPRRQRSKGGFRTKAEAISAMHDMQTAVVAGRYVPASRLTLGRYLMETWLPAVKASVRPGTWDSYESYIRLYAVPRLGDVPLQSLSRADLRKFYADLEESGRRRGTGGLSPKTVHNVHITLLKALGDAVEDQLIPRNPAMRAHRARSEPSRMTTWSAEQVRLFLSHVQDDPLQGLWRLAVATGMRRAEVLGLRWRDVDFRAGQLAVVQTRLKGNGTTFFAGPKTPRSRRTIALDPTTIDALRRHRRAQAAERAAAGDAYADHGLVFCFPNGDPLDPDGVNLRFQRHARDAGLPRIRFHDLRHTHATLGLMASVNPKVMQERLGHSSVAFTLDIYSHALPTMQEEAAMKVAALFDAPSTAPTLHVVPLGDVESSG